MSASGHAAATEERRLNFGLQYTPSGRPLHPVARGSEFHRSINQKLPELWADFSDKGHPEARAGHDERSVSFHGGFGLATTSSREGQFKERQQVVFAGFAEFDMDGRTHTAGEMDRIMAHAAVSKYPCARPATLDEYTGVHIVGLPLKNQSGRDVVFTGPGATGCELYHTNTLGAQKCFVPPGDAFDGSIGAASLYGRKCIVCVFPVERVRRQQSLAQFGVVRAAIGSSGRLRRAGSMASLKDTTQWTCSSFGRSSSQAANTSRMDQFFR